MADKPRRTRKTKLENIAEQVEKTAVNKTNRKPTSKAILPEELIPSGSTLLNLACTDTPFGAYKLGTIITVPGSSSSGKTALMLTAFAEMIHNERFDDYRFIYDDAEEALAFNVEYLFGKKTSDRIEAPAYIDEEPVYSNTIQDFKANVLAQCSKGNPFIYVLDSLDSLSSTEEMEREYKAALKQAKNPEQIKEVTGSYKTEKAKMLGEILRMINGKLKDSKSCLFIIQQIRQKIGVVFGKKSTTSGGNAPFFYSSIQVWLNKMNSIKAKDRKIGNSVKAEVLKNKLTGKLRDIEFDIFYSYGVDDIASCVDFLIKEGHWKKAKQTITAHEFEIEGVRATIIDHIESNGLQRKLQEITGIVWNEIEEDIKITRTRKFGV